ncbi:MAG: Hsp20/alpha crystallin family protein [Thermoplasmata archaeon]|nr:MAG: Hsp20/alpha crystallin family protein [Thermoplasmata archaeon]
MMPKKYRRFPFFDDLDDFGFNSDFEQMWEKMDAMMEEIRSHPDYEKGKPIYYGYTVEMGPDGIPKVHEYGNVRPGKKIDGALKTPDDNSLTSCSTSESECGCSAPALLKSEIPGGEEDVIEPYTCSIFNEKKKELKINAEVPGISKEDIDLELKDNKLILTAKNDKKNYRAVIQLDQEVSKRSIKANYNNGVLEITLKCKKPTRKSKGKKIEVN